MGLVNKEALKQWFFSSKRPSWTLRSGRTKNGDVVSSNPLMKSDIDMQNIDTIVSSSWDLLNSALEERGYKGTFYLELLENKNATASRLADVLEFSGNGIGGFQNQQQQNGYGQMGYVTMIQGLNQSRQAEQAQFMEMTTSLRIEGIKRDAEYKRREEVRTVTEKYNKLKKEFEDHKKDGIGKHMVNEFKPYFVPLAAKVLGLGKVGIGHLDDNKQVNVPQQQEQKGQHKAINYTSIVYSVMAIKPHFDEIELMLQTIAQKINKSDADKNELIEALLPVMMSFK